MKTQTLPAKNKSSLLSIGKILVPSDFSPASENAFRYALRFGQEFGADLFLIHVLPPPLAPTFPGEPATLVFPKSEATSAKKSLRVWVESAQAVGVNATVGIRNGLPEHEIVEAAKEHDVDLVIIATHGYTGWKHFCIGSTAERVVRAAPCPVLVVREKEHDFV